MRIIDEKETIRWLSARGILDSAGTPTYPGLVQVIDSRIPVDSGRKTALSRAIVSFFDRDDEAILWINEFGIWESSEDRYLFDGFRRSLGENNPLHEKPGHIFSTIDLMAVQSLVAMMLYFVWGGILYSPAREIAVEISHDEFISVFARHREDASDINEKLKKYV